MPVTPEIGIVWVSSLYLPTPIAYDLANGLGSLDNYAFGAFTFTYLFRLECFAVYASPLSLPSDTQDSLRGEAGTPSTAGLSPAR